jgi:hypothetical protein
MWWWLPVLCLLSPFTSRADDLQPKLALVRPVFDFGRVERGTFVDHAFEVVNEGAGPLRIEHVKSTCHCTAGAVTTGDVPPGERTRVTVRLDTRQLAGPTAKTITVYTNDPAVPAFGLTVRGEVLSDLIVDPALVYVGVALPGQVPEQVVQVRPGRPDGTARVRRIEAPSFIETEIEMLPDGTGQAVRIRLRTDAPVGRFHHELRLHTTSASQKTIALPVFGVIAGADEQPLPGRPLPGRTVPPT